MTNTNFLWLYELCSQTSFSQVYSQPLSFVGAKRKEMVLNGRDPINMFVLVSPTK